MGRIIYRSGKFSVFLIVVLLFQIISSSMISVASAATSTEPTAKNLYFTEKDQNEKIQELKVEKKFSIDLVLQEGQDSEAEVQLPEGISLNNESLAQEGLSYEEITRTLKVDWTKFTALEQKKRVPLSFTSSFFENVSIQAKTVRDGRNYYSHPLNLISASSESTSTKQETISEEPVKEEGSSKASANDVTSSANADSGVTINDKDSNKQADGTTGTRVKAFSGISAVAAAAAFTINNTDSYAFVQNNVDPMFRIYQLNGTSTGVIANVTLNTTINPNIANWMTAFNGLAVSKDGYIYGMAAGKSGTTPVSQIFKIDSSGKVVKQIVTLEGTAAATMIGNKYYYINGTTLVSYDVTNGQRTTKALVNNAGAPLTGVGADLVADADGYLWVSQNDNLLQVNPATGGIIRALPVPGLSTQLPDGVRGMSFLVDGRILVTSAGYNELNTRFTIDEDGKLTSLGTIPGVGTTSFGIADLGSAVTPKFEPYPPVVESDKTFKILKKGTGTLVDQFQAGDTLVYTVRARNTKAAPSILKGLSITDSIPAGVEYVPGTLMVDNKSMSDVADTDQGEVIAGKVTGRIGDVLDTNYHTVEFQVKVLPGNDGKTILNTADVTSLNADPQHPTAEFVVQPPVPPENACGQLGRAALINGSFEQPSYKDVKNVYNGWFDAPVGTVPGWKTTDPANLFEFFAKDLMDKIPAGSREDTVLGLKNSVPHGEQFAELNSRNPAQLYQDVQTTPGQTLYWRLAHKGRQGLDTMALKIGSSATQPKDLPTVQQITTDKYQWKYYTGTYTVPAGQTVTRFGFEAVSSTGGNPAAGNFLDDIFLGTEPCVTATKSVSPEGQVKTGDELTYNVKVKNDGGDVASNTVFTDAIPEGTEYVPGTIKVIKDAKVTVITDANDTDSGYYQDRKVTANLGDLPNTDILPDGVTVQFKVKVSSGYVNKQIKNKAQVTYKNLLANKDGFVETNEVVNDVISQEAKVESQKTAKNLQDKPIQVEDEIEYTIQMRNTVSDSIVKNAVIEDQLPEGLEYVPGTLQVNGKPVTDTEGDDTGHYVQGKVTGQLGDITDTEWHTIVFHAKVKVGQAGQDIQNTAKVTGENVPPQEPSTTVEVYPRNPKVESKKTAKNLQDKNIEVGDEIEYTIQMRNTVPDSIVKNAIIEDQLPEALEYVPGTLQVNGQSVTDAEGDDAGHYAQGKVTGQLGDITNTEWHTVVFHAKVKAGQEGKAIQNTAKVSGEEIPPQEPTTEIKVQPLGQIEIEKVDAADSAIKLKNAVFQILDKDGKEVGKLTTDENGKATSELLILGKYTVKEIQAPNGYMLLKDPIEVEVSSPLQKITVENTKNGWDIPHTGGIGTTVFYLIGMIIMVAVLVVFFRKRETNK
ncbi:hypothetical protein AYK81_24490 [Bacillus thuringiensis]|nr:hypothetical protein AYK81_24490 [Bacillus thuringiensis]